MQKYEVFWFLDYKESKVLKKSVILHPISTRREPSSCIAIAEKHDNKLTSK